jgi:hypothetical protein
MEILDEFYLNPVFHFSCEELIKVLQELKINKEQEIELLKEKIKKYEQKRRSHEVWYQSLSPVRRFFAGRPPSHHQAVEYIVNVKERFQMIEQIKSRINEINKMIDQLRAEPGKEKIILANVIINDIKEWKEKEDRQQ